MRIKCFPFFFFILIFSGTVIAQTVPLIEKDIHSLKVTDFQLEPIFGVYVINKSHSQLLTTTDIDGECRIDLRTISGTDSIAFQGMGFQVVTICAKELNNISLIKLKELQFELSETLIKGITMEALLKKATVKLKKTTKGITPLCKNYGKAQYEKIVHCNDKSVEYRREYGYYLTSGDIIPKNEWDQNHRSYFLPEYCARSFNLMADSKDTLTPQFLTSDNIRFDVGTRKIFTLMRTVQLFAPLFNDIQYFDIQSIDLDSPDYTFSFSTKPAAYPNKIRISCRGTFTISREQHELTEMTFDYMDYQLFRQSIMTKHRKTGSPFSTKALLTFAYDDTQQCYVQSCIQETTWKNNLGENFILIEQPSRAQPAENKLIEQEAFYCYNYKPLPEKFLTPGMLSKIHLAQRYPKGKYDAGVFEELPELLDNRETIKDLSRYAAIESQFRHHSDKIYYPDNYILDFKANTAETQKKYRKKLEEIRGKLLKELEETDPLLPLAEYKKTTGQ